MTRARMGWHGLVRVGLVLALMSAACGPAKNRQASEQPARMGPTSFLLVTIDTWRWDYIGISGAGKVTTPNLDRLAREGVYEREAVTPCPLTTPAHASLFTGLNPPNHGVLDCTGFSLPPTIPTLAEAFKQRGFHTAAFVSGEPLKARYGLDRGFEVYDDSGMGTRGAGDWHPAGREGERVVDAALAHFSRIVSDRPVFLWVHFFDAHLPYRGHQPFAGQYPGRPYAAEVAYVDAQVGRLTAGLPRMAGEWRIVIAGDHGEGLGDHGESEHGYGLYRSTIHVPLIFHPAPEPPLRHARPWSLVDLAPTLRAWLALPEGGPMDGENLFRDGRSARVLPTISLLPSFAFGVQPTLGARQGNFNYLRHRQEELYDLAQDPDETADLGRDPAHRSAFRVLRQAAMTASGSAIQQAMDRAYHRPSDEDLRALASLGYLSGGGKVRLAALPAGDLHELLREGRDLDQERERAFSTGDIEALRQRFGRLCLEYPSSTFFLKNYASLSMRKGDHRAAIEAYRRIVRLDPQDSGSMTNWGTACLMLGEWREAATLLEGALKLNERDALAHKNLAILYGEHFGRPSEALRHVERYLEIEPQAPDRAQAEAWIQDLRRREAAAP